MGKHSTKPPFAQNLALPPPLPVPAYLAALPTKAPAPLPYTQRVKPHPHTVQFCQMAREIVDVFTIEAQSGDKQNICVDYPYYDPGLEIETLTPELAKEAAIIICSSLNQLFDQGQFNAGCSFENNSTIDPPPYLSTLFSIAGQWSEEEANRFKSRAKQFFNTVQHHYLTEHVSGLAR